jgi:hypothetical protein
MASSERSSGPIAVSDTSTKPASIAITKALSAHGWRSPSGSSARTRSSTKIAPRSTASSAHAMASSESGVARSRKIARKASPIARCTAGIRELRRIARGASTIGTASESSPATKPPTDRSGQAASEYTNAASSSPSPEVCMR